MSAVDRLALARDYLRDLRSGSPLTDGAIRAFELVIDAATEQQREIEKMREDLNAVRLAVGLQ